jgi:hypothetical protein
MKSNDGCVLFAADKAGTYEKSRFFLKLLLAGLVAFLLVHFGLPDSDGSRALIPFLTAVLFMLVNLLPSKFRPDGKLFVSPVRVAVVTEKGGGRIAVDSLPLRSIEGVALGDAKRKNCDLLIFSPPGLTSPLYVRRGEGREICEKIAELRERAGKEEGRHTDSSGDVGGQCGGEGAEGLSLLPGERVLLNTTPSRVRLILVSVVVFAAGCFLSVLLPEYFMEFVGTSKTKAQLMQAACFLFFSLLFVNSLAHSIAAKFIISSHRVILKNPARLWSGGLKQVQMKNITSVYSIEKTAARGPGGAGAIGLVYVSTSSGLAMILDKVKSPLLVEGAIFKGMSEKLKNQPGTPSS